MKYQIVFKRKIEKALKALPENIKDLFFILVSDMKESGVLQPGWKNFSKLGNNKYHCHLTYSYVACWELKDNKITIEVYYVGSRENAPY
ncbi:MAG: hypothetical protein WCR55_13875 [Lentisphaerota bacterium]